MRSLRSVSSPQGPSVKGGCLGLRAWTPASDRTLSRSGRALPLQEAAAASQLRTAFKTDEVRHVHVRLHLRVRRAACQYVPCYVISYAYGSQQRGSLEILEQGHMALVAGTAGVPAHAPLHFSPLKAQLGAAGTVLAAHGAASAAASGVPASALAALQLLSVDAAFFAFLAAAAAGAAARAFTNLARSRHSRQVEADVEALLATYMQAGRSALHSESRDDERLRADVEWLRWEQSEPWHWDADRQRKQALDLLRVQSRRRCASLVGSIAGTAVRETLPGPADRTPRPSISSDRERRAGARTST